MDPNFIPIIFSQLSQHTQAMGVAKQQASEEHEKQVLQESRQKLFDAAAAESESMLHESSAFPQRAFIRSQWFCFNLSNLKVVPDSYDGQKEKENVELLWRKLVGISDKCKKMMTPEQFEQSTKCLDAIWMQGFIQAIVENYPAYANYLDAKVKLDQKIIRLRNFERSLYVVLLLIVGLICLFYFTHTLIETTADFIGYQILLAGMPALLIRSIFRPQYDQIENSYTDFKPEGEQGKFWSMVKEKFGNIPTQAVLDETWKQQEEIIRIVFGNPASTDEQG